MPKIVTFVTEPSPYLNNKKAIQSATNEEIRARKHKLRQLRELHYARKYVPFRRPQEYRDIQLELNQLDIERKRRKAMRAAFAQSQPK